MARPTVAAEPPMTASLNAKPSESPAMVPLLVAAALTIAVGSVAPDWNDASLLMILAAVLVLTAVVNPHSRRLGQIGVRLLPLMLGLGIGVEVVAGLVYEPLVPEPAYRAAQVAVGILSMAAFVTARQPLGRAVLGLAVAAHFGLLAWTISAAPDPFIDVHQFQQEGSAALVRGENPYALRFVNIYGPDTEFYAKEVMDGDRVKFGFPYPPLSLLAAAPGYVVAGDYRFAGLLAVSGTAVVMSLVRPGRLATGVALLLLMAPTTTHVIYWGWTEPFIALAIAATAYAAIRRVGATALALGALVALKQYLLPVLVLAPLIMRDVRRAVGSVRMVGIAVAVLLITSLPFLAWDPGSFIYSTVTFHGLQPFRIDALNFSALSVRMGLPELPAWVGFAAAAWAAGVALLRTPRTAAGFFGALALVLITFFLFGKQGFVNYYFIAMVSLLAGAVSASDRLGAGRGGPHVDTE